MKKYKLLPMAIFGCAIFVLAGCSQTTPAKVEMRSENVPGEPESSSSEKVKMKTDGRYEPFTPEVLADASNSRRVLFFYANWCPTCKPANESFIKNEQLIPQDVKLIRVNYNDSDTDQTEKDLAKKYAVTYQHTYVQIDAQGNELKKWNGGEIEELLSNIK
ncbi:MAG: thioredoxin domain-containing protein [Patescibacteria group bacterium]